MSFRQWHDISEERTVCFSFTAKARGAFKSKLRRKVWFLYMYLLVGDLAALADGHRPS